MRNVNNYKFKTLLLAYIKSNFLEKAIHQCYEL